MPLFRISQKKSKGQTFPYFLKILRINYNSVSCKKNPIWLSESIFKLNT